MQNELYKYQENAMDCETIDLEKSSLDHWNPNVPFIGTQEEWWEHFHQIENGKFYPVSEVHQRISQWLDNQRP